MPPAGSAELALRGVSARSSNYSQFDLLYVVNVIVVQQTKVWLPFSSGVEGGGQAGALDEG